MKSTLTEIEHHFVLAAELNLLPHQIKLGMEQLITEAKAFRDHVAQLEKQISDGFVLSDEGLRFLRFMNGLDIDDLDERAERFMYTFLDGLMVGPNNRESIKSALSRHFRDIAEKAKHDG